MKPDREAAWLNYKGWRVNYDTVLMAPYAPWLSDRSLRPTGRLSRVKSPFVITSPNR